MELYKVMLFASKDCSECQKVLPSIRRLCEEHKVNFEVCFAEDDLTKFDQFKVTGFPTFMVFNGYEQIGLFVGHQTEISLENNLRKLGVINGQEQEEPVVLFV